MKRAIIVGSHGQDGQLLYDFLLKRRYSIAGIDKNQIRCFPDLSLKKVDILKFKEVANFVNKFQPSEIYYLAAFHHSSEDLPIENIELMKRSYSVHVAGLLNFLEATRIICSKARLFYAASSHIFSGEGDESQDESMPINPTCIYGITKASGLALCRLYRSHHGIFAAGGILYNHESALRTGNFVSKKIISGAINIKRGKQKRLVLGDLGAVIDWGYAPDYVRAMHLILNLETPSDFVVATGKPHTVLDFVKETFKCLDLDWKMYIETDCHTVFKKNFYRIGNPTKLKMVTGWMPSVEFKEMVQLLLVQGGAFD